MVARFPKATLPAAVAALALACGACPGPKGDSGAESGSDGGAACVGSPAVASMVEDAGDLVGGPMATGLVGTGDVVLENDNVRVLIQGPGRNVAINPFGGNIIDADVRRPGGTGEDILGEVGLLLNIVGTSTADSVSIVQQGTGCGPAVVRATGSYALSDYINPNTIIPSITGAPLLPLDEPWPLDIQIDYELSPDDRHVVMKVTLTSTSPTDTVPIALGYLVHGGRGDTWSPAVGGFVATDFGDFDFLRIVGERSAYALVPVSAQRDRLVISVAGGFVMAHDAISFDLLQFPTAAPAFLAPGESITYETWFVVGRTLSEVEAVAALAVGRPACVEIRGRVEEDGSATPLANADVTAIDVGPTGIETAPVAHARSEADGAVVLCVSPQRSAALIAGRPGRPYAGGGLEPERLVVDVGTEPSAGPELDFVLTLPETGTLTATITAEDGSGLPARLTVLGVDPSPRTPLLRGDGYDPMAPGVAHQSDSIDGTFAFELEPGDYDVVVTRGPEYSMLRTQVTVTAGAAADVTGTLYRVLDTTGYLSGDFHVHAQMSPDATILLFERVRNCAAENLEVFTSSDQAFVTDYEPVIGDVGAEPFVASFAGEEVATPDYGHFNIFPMLADPTQHNRGANDWPGLDVVDIVALRTNILPGTPGIVQINHPRAIPAPGLANYFIQIDLQFDATGPSIGANAIAPDLIRLMPAAELLSTGFDSMEIMTWANVQGLSDWFNFLNAGVAFTAVGNSDTHTIHVESSGWPRNFVAAGMDDPASIDPGAFIDAIRGGASSVSFGPFIVVAAREPGGPEVPMGGMLDAATTGMVEIVLRLQAADWVDVDRLDFYENGLLVRSEPVAPPLVPVGTSGEMRYEMEFVHAASPAADAWYVVVATGTTPLYPARVYNESDPATLSLADIRVNDVLAPLLPFAATNAVWVDVDGDGAITPSHVVLPEDFMMYRAEDRTNPY